MKLLRILMLPLVITSGALRANAEDSALKCLSVVRHQGFVFYGPVGSEDKAYIDGFVSKDAKTGSVNKPLQLLITPVEQPDGKMRNGTWVATLDGVQLYEFSPAAPGKMLLTDVPFVRLPLKEKMGYLDAYVPIGSVYVGDPQFPNEEKLEGFSSVSTSKLVHVPAKKGEYLEATPVGPLFSNQDADSGLARAIRDKIGRTRMLFVTPLDKFVAETFHPGQAESIRRIGNEMKQLRATIDFLKTKPGHETAIDVLRTGIQSKEQERANLKKGLEDWLAKALAYRQTYAGMWAQVEDACGFLFAAKPPSGAGQRGGRGASSGR